MTLHLLKSYGRGRLYGTFFKIGLQIVGGPNPNKALFKSLFHPSGNLMVQESSQVIG